MASSTVSFLNTNSGAIQAVSTAALVLITWWYAVETKKAVAEAQATRLDARLPIIEPLDISGPSIDRDDQGAYEYLPAHLKNIGYGPALDVKVHLPEGKSQELWNIPQGEDGWYHIRLEKDEAQILTDIPEESKKISIKYLDVFGREVITVMHYRAKKRENGTQTWFTFELAKWHLTMPKEDNVSQMEQADAKED